MDSFSSKKLTRVNESKRIESLLNGTLCVSTGFLVYQMSKAYVNPYNVNKMIYVASISGFLFTYGWLRLIESF
jgi:hypothetical protein